MRILFFIIDFAFFILLTAAMVTLRYGGFSYNTFSVTFEALIPAFLISTMVLWVFSFYDFNLIRKNRLDYKNIIIAFTLSVLLSSFCIYISASRLNLATPKLILLTVLLSYFLYTYISRRIYAAFTIAQQKIMLLGKSNSLTDITKELKYYKEFKLQGPFESISDIKMENTDIIIMGSKFLLENKDAWAFISSNFISKGVLLTTDYNFYESLFRRCSKGSLKDAQWLLRGVASRQSSYIYPAVKRAIDILFSIVLIPAFLPFFLITWLLIRCVDGWDPLFKQKRIGKLESTINIYKFRTMKPGTEEISRLGNILRRFRIDEIPQLINIFRGDISIVGPRPLAFEDYKAITEKVPANSIRNIIKPGLTGWAQLNFKAPPNYSKNKGELPKGFLDAAKIRLCYDIWYIKNRSLFLDIEIILKTAKRAFIKDKTFD